LVREMMTAKALLLPQDTPSKGPTLIMALVGSQPDPLVARSLLALALR
jgi:hypothetical protein